jgi:hypothetical protein
MPNWKFWDKPPEPTVPAPVAVDAHRRFSAKPRTDLVPSVSDPALEDKLNRLRRQRESVLFDVEQAELANADENPWLERVDLLDEALANVRSDRDRWRAESRPPGRAFPATPIESIAWSAEPVPAVAFTIGNQDFRYEEEIDWAERGFQLARSELMLTHGDPAALIPSDVPDNERPALLGHLTSSLFVFATNIRDRELEGAPLPATPTLSDLANPDTVNGGWLDWSGHSSEGARKEAEGRRLDDEERRLLAERARELDELARWQDRLPIARRRLTDVDAAIDALVGEP